MKSTTLHSIVVLIYEVKGHETMQRQDNTNYLHQNAFWGGLYSVALLETCQCNVFQSRKVL